jgi:hypothetical protein
MEEIIVETMSHAHYHLVLRNSKEFYTHDHTPRIVAKIFFKYYFTFHSLLFW